MKIKKVIEIPFGCCSEHIEWTVGSNYCTLVGTYPEKHGKDLLTTKIGEIPTWKFILDYLGEKIK